MSATLIPELYASKTKSAHAILNAEIYASKNIPAHAILNAEIYASVDPLLYKVEAEFDTKRIVNNDKITIYCDTKRSLANSERLEADTVRRIASDLIQTRVEADSQRQIINQISPGFDTKREVESIFIQVIASFDTTRSKTNEISVEYDTERKILNNTTVEGDTKRKLTVLYSVNLNADTKRKVLKEIYPEFDTSRDLPIYANVEFDTERNLSKIVEITCDTARKIPHKFDNIVNSGVQSISMTLQTNTLSDTFTLTGVNPIYPLDEVDGTLLDFPYHFRAEEVEEKGILFTVNRATYDTAQMVYTLFNFSLEADTNISNLMGTIANILGFKSQIRVTNNFAPTTSYENQNITYQSLISSYFGWSENIPRKKYIIFIRNRDTLHCLQRGNETGNINLDTYKFYNTPTYNRLLIRTAWMKPTDEKRDDTSTEVKPIRYIFPGAPPALDPWDPDGWKYGWAKGVVPPTVETTVEEVPRSDGKTVDNRITKSTRYNQDGSVTTTTYDYIPTKRSYLISTIHEATVRQPTVDPSTGVASGGYRNEKVTCYQYFAGGIRKVTVYVNNKKVEETEDHYQEEEDTETNDSAENAYRGRASGDEGNEFTDEQSSLSYGGEWRTEGTSSGSSFLDEDDDIPVYDSDTRNMYWTELEWMDRSIQETVSLTITAPVKNGVIAKEDNHVFDFFDTYTLKGKVYFLESNSVTFTPRSLKQQLTLIRWYKPDDGTGREGD